MSIQLSCRRKRLYEQYGKRLLDIVSSLLALLALSPILCIVTVFIVVNSRGGPFFFQKRIGRWGRTFSLIKFRSMVSDTRKPKKEFEPGSSERITSIGRILRKTKVDELPALFNVLFGDMSIVGPRPEVEQYVLAFSEDFDTILRIRPGLSDNASIKYRDEEEILSRQRDPEQYYRHVILPDKLRLARKYIKEASFSTDMRIIGRTIRSIVGKKDMPIDSRSPRGY